MRQFSEDRHCHFLTFRSNFADRTHARWASGLAGTVLNEFQCLCQQVGIHAIQRLTETDAAGVFVVEIDIGLENHPWFVVRGSLFSVRIPAPKSCLLAP